MPKLDDKVAVITGASSGIGRATAEMFAKRGATVVLVARSEQALETAAQSCRSHGAEAVAMCADVQDADAIEDVARQTAGKFGRIDVWVNNASVMLFAPIDEAPVDLWHNVIETNVFGTFHGFRSALPWMREQGEGVIINVSSVLGHLSSQYLSAYVASKHATLGLADCARQEVRDVPGIHVCNVLPGPIDTPIFQHAANVTGREVKPLTPVIDARRVAATIASCAARPRREVVVGAVPALGVRFDRAFPKLVERFTGRQLEDGHFTDRVVARTDGIVNAPADGTGSVSGGWSRSAAHVGPEAEDAVSSGSRSSRAVPVAAGAAGVAGGAAALGVLARRRRS